MESQVEDTVNKPRSLRDIRNETDGNLYCADCHTAVNYKLIPIYLLS